MPVPYPLSLRTILRASKSRSQAAAFSMSEPRRGYAYTQMVGTDVPVFWDVQFRFTKDEAIRFQLWLKYSLQEGSLEFILPIDTEFGLLDHTCKFVPDGLADAKEDGGIWTYGAKIMARAQVIPQGYTDAAEIIVGLPDWNEWMVPLDIAISVLP